MNAPDPATVRRIVEELLDLEEQARDARLLELASDAPLRAAVEALLRRVTADDGFLDPPTEGPELGPGKRLGAYELIAEIGRGSSGVVWSARDAKLQRLVAIKVLWVTPLTSKQAIERFRREAQNVAKLSHPGIAAIYSVEHHAPLHFFAMEFVGGADLRTVLRRQRSQQPTLLPGPGQPGRFTEIARACAETASALQHAHDHGIVHRDVKPENILLRENRSSVLVDFGLARAESMGTLTATGELAGTLHYMSPEQLLADRHRVDHRTDVFSLGVVLYEMLTLEQPFRGSTSQLVIARIQSTEPRAPRRIDPRVPVDLATICATAMEKEPSRRYQTAGALAADLQNFLNHEPIVAHRPGPWLKVRRFARRRRALAAGLATAVLASLVAGWTGWRAATFAAERESLRPIASLVKAQDWSRLTEGDLFAARQLLVNQRATVRAHVGDATIERLEQEFEELWDRWKREGVGELRKGMTGEGPDPRLTIDDQGLMRGVLKLATLSRLFPDRPPAIDTRSLSPRISLTVVNADLRPLTGTAKFVHLEPLTGQPMRGSAEPLGSLPLHSVPVPSGFGRIVVELGEHGHREFTRMMLHTDPDIVIHHQVREEQQDRRDMVRISGMDFAVPTTPGSPSPLMGARIVVAPFWMDRYEVSNAEYRRFVDATGHRAPPYWNLVPAGSPADELPVAFVGWEDARAFAEWRGKRLPTHGEWYLAARGSTGRPYPWGDEPKRLGNAWRSASPLGDSAAMQSLYLTNAAPVASHSDATTPEGLFHMFGNLGEWCESLFVGRPFGRWMPLLDRRLILGGAWHSGHDGTLAHFEHGGTDPQYLFPYNGFRCVRSEVP